MCVHWLTRLSPPLHNRLLLDFEDGYEGGEVSSLFHFPEFRMLYLGDGVCSHKDDSVDHAAVGSRDMKKPLE